MSSKIRIPAAVAFAATCWLLIGAAVYGQPAPTPGPAPTPVAEQPAKIWLSGATGCKVVFNDYVSRPLWSPKQYTTAPVSGASFYNVTVSAYEGGGSQITGTISFSPGQVVYVSCDWAALKLVTTEAQKMPAGQSVPTMTSSCPSCANGQCSPRGRGVFGWR